MSETNPNASLSSGKKPYLVIIGLCLLVYFQSLFFDYILLDDYVIVTQRESLGRISNIGTAFTRPMIDQASPYYRPVFDISYIINALIAGDASWIYHLTNLLIHLLVACLVFVLLVRLGASRDTALLLALIFGVHPMLVQSVAWIPGRTDMLMAVFAIPAFISAMNFTEHQRWKYLRGYLLFYALALFTKETAAVFIGLVILYLHLIRKERFLCRSEIALGIGWFVVTVVWFILRSSALSGMSPQPGIGYIVETIAGNLWQLAVFLGRAVLPFDPGALTALSIIWGIIGTLVLLGGLWISRRKSLVPAIFGLGWFIIFLLPALIGHGTYKLNVLALEPRIYLPLVGLMIILAQTGWAKSLGSGNKAHQKVAIALVGVLAVLTALRANYFREPLSFWQNAAQIFPDLGEVHLRLGRIYQLRGNLNSAEAQYAELIKAEPQNPMGYYYLGILYKDKAMPEQSQQALSKANYYMANQYFMAGQLDMAIGLYADALAIYPEYAESYYGRASAYGRKKIYDKAVADGEMFLKLAPHHTLAGQMKQWIVEWEKQVNK
jgi:Tfp pilus assembly protein PilF